MRPWMLWAIASSFWGHEWYQEPWEIQTKPRQRQIVGISRALDSMIEFHQAVISPADGPRSHFRPSSSQYMRDSIAQEGFLKGYLKGCDRLLRENNEKWVYPTIEIDGVLFKYDPVRRCSFQ